MLGPESARRLPHAHAQAAQGYSPTTYSNNDDEYDEYEEYIRHDGPHDRQRSTPYSMNATAAANPTRNQHPRRVRQDTREPTTANARHGPSSSPASPHEHTPRTSSRPASPSYRDAMPSPSGSHNRGHVGASTSSAPSSSQQPTASISLAPQPRSRESSKNAVEHLHHHPHPHHQPQNNYYGIGTSTSALDRLNSTRRLMAQLDPDDAESIAPDRGTWASDWRESVIDRDPNRSSLEVDDAAQRSLGQGYTTRSGAGFPRNSSTSVVTVDGGDPFPYSAYDGMPLYDDSIEHGILASFPIASTADNHRPSPLNLIPPRGGAGAESQHQTLAPSSDPLRIGDNSPSTEAFLSDPRALLASTPTRETSLGPEESSRANRPDLITIPPHGASPPTLSGSSSPTWSVSVAQTGRVASRTSARNFSRPFVAVEEPTTQNELAVPPLPPQYGRNQVSGFDSSDSIDQLARQSSLGHSSSIGHSTSGHESSMGHGASSQGGHSLSSSWEERRLMGLRGVELAKREMLLKSHSGAMERLKEEERDESTERRARHSESSGASSPEGKSHLPIPAASPAMARQLPAISLSTTDIPGSMYPERSSSTRHNSPIDQSPHPHHPAFDRDASSTSPSPRTLPIAPSQGQSPSSPHLSPCLNPPGPSADPRVSLLENPRAPPAPPLHLFNSPTSSSYHGGFDGQSSSPVEARSVQMPSPTASPPRQRNVLRKRRPSDAAARAKDGITPPPEGTMPSLPQSTALAIEVALREDPFAASEGQSGRWAKFRSRSHSSKTKIRPSYGPEADMAAEYEREADSASVPHITFEPPSRPTGDLRDLVLRAKQLSEQRHALEALSLKPSVAKSAAAGIVQRGDGKDLAPGWVQKDGDGEPEDEMESLAVKSLIRPPGISPKERSVSDQGPQRLYSDASEEENGLSVSVSHARPGTANSLYSNYSFYSLPTTMGASVFGGSKPGSIRSPTEAQQSHSSPRAPSSMSISHPTFEKAKAGRKVEMTTTPEGEVVPRNEPQTCEDYLSELGWNNMVVGQKMGGADLGFSTVLGIHYHENGELPRAAWYFEQSAKQDGGCPAGMLMHALTLRHGWGCQVNTQLGFKYLQAAAESVVEDIDHEKAGDHDTKASKNELVLALHEIGVSFRFGWGVPRDKKMAVAYFTLAADLGDVDAQTDLAFCYANGKGCKKDLRMAAHYYRLAVKQGAESFGLSWIWKAKYD
ncbi:BZ3500_MvSof-1268-A1-R1_Chr1-1g00905 [Microbotryum saponariae]|uniref:BZ3500_MvSof-1268-A1-R1_Chr1-1g00905 protein n=1 Tax=Microbotryum saponariae TaxID=289078 RepID=A0A2X0M4C5_9BASI|nr:BZ3500_MvSof-1268-A1-R1_Chr1-1g00905 [Microbotryum saponariae]SCZ92902.1 BZ3501_MvSof-1269-A2-R1_Chr1-1g00502 [Microbotryum saponariae]